MSGRYSLSKRHPLPAFMKLLVGLALLLICAGCLPKVTRIEGGDLSGELFWQGQINIYGDVEVSASSHLVIAPGTDVVFHPAPAALDRWHDHPHFSGSELVIRGSLQAEGTMDNPIRFRAVEQAAPAAAWGGINIIGSPDARFSYCRFSSADSALHIQESTVFIQNSVFTGNLVGIRFHSSAIRIEHNRIENNDTGIRFHYGAPVISHNLILDNRRGIFITSHPQDFRIENNQFENNRDYHVVLGEEVPENLFLGHNWWGTTEVEDVQSLVYDGRREPHLGTVKLRPLLGAPAVGGGPQ